MAKFAFKNATVLYGPLDISGDTNRITLEAAATELSTSNFAGDGWKEFVTGIKNGNASFAGFLENAAQPDAQFFNNVTGIPVTIARSNPVAAADVAYALQVARTRYSPKLPVGELYGFDLATAGQTPVVRGVILATEDATAASDEAAALEVGEIAEGQYAYAALHVIALSGSSITFDGIIESDTVEAFNDDPTTRFTFSQVTDVTGVSSEWGAKVAGPIADHAWWRFAYTISGTGTFSYRAFLGIQ